MDRLLYVLPLLACPAAMGLMMWLMMRGGRSNSTASEQSAPTGQPTSDALESPDVARLRAEVAALRARIDADQDNRSRQ